MASIFVSHSSKDDALVHQLEDWLKDNGFTDLFVDHSHIRVGMKWADALRAAAGTCRVVVCLITENWLTSEQCIGEFNAAWYMGKRLLPLLLVPSDLSDTSRIKLHRVVSEDQGLDLMPFYSESAGLEFTRDEALAENLRAGLRAAGAFVTAGLDPEAFEVDRVLIPVPFPGLTSFGDDDADAALFFGRSREIAETLEELRAMRATNDRRPLVILGASGSGKSSLLRAGIIPRLRRETPAWIALRAFRPGADPLFNFAEAVTRTLADFGVCEAPGAISRVLLQARKNVSDPALPMAGQGEIATALEALGARLRRAAARPGATILVSLDQAEELARTEDESTAALTDLLRAMLASGTGWKLALTIRTDSFPELQSHPHFAGLEARGYDLRVLPTYRFADVVILPAKRYGVLIEPALVDQLMEDAPNKDALPLLAFALQRLWNQFSAECRLGLPEYRAMGELAGLIGGAAERALCAIEPEQWDVALPKDGARKVQDEVGKRTFVPPLADVNEDGAVVRRLAPWIEFDEEQKVLLDRFDRWRLVVRKGYPSSVEVAHEALFRDWPRLAGWLEPERTRLEALRGLVVATDAWTRNRKKRNFAIHSGRRLREVETLQRMPRYRNQIDPIAASYIKACRGAARRRVLGLIGAVAAIPIALVLAVAGLLVSIRMESEALQIQAKRRYVGHVQSNAVLASAETGSEFQDCRADSQDCPAMVILPAGEYLMGSKKGDPAANDDEFPQRLVSIPRFAVSKYEITWDEWLACEDSGGCMRIASTYSDSSEGWQPARGMNWDNAKEYATWLSRMTGKTYRLLSEAEWEYAARAVTTSGAPTTGYSWGDALPVCDSRADNGARFANCQPRGTSEVGTFKSNRFGLYDMHGNVAEWVEDCQKSSYSGAPSNESALTTDGCFYHMVRGGSWLDGPQNLRSAFRDGYIPSIRVTDFGFRVARTL